MKERSAGNRKISSGIEERRGVWSVGVVSMNDREG